MKKLLMPVLVIVCFTFSANAQKKKEMSHQMKQHHQKAMMMQHLNLTTAQKNQMKANRESYKKQLEDLKKNDGISVKEYREKKEAIHKAQKEKAMAVLTPEQKTQLEQLKKEEQQKHKMKSAERMEKMKSRLGLTDEQAAKLKANREDINTKMKAIKENNKLSSEEKKQQLKELKKQNKDIFRDMLTPDQLKKMQDMKQHHF